MKPRKIKCPICGKEMLVRSYGMRRIDLYGRATINDVHYECSCGCKVEYEGKLDCWEKCKCKSYDIKFQNHYPYEEDVPVKIGDKLVGTDKDLKRRV